MSDISRYREATLGLSAPELIVWALKTFGADGLVCASSMGAEDQVLTHLIAQHAPAIPIFTLDTGRLFHETHDLIERTRARYGVALSVYFPDAREVEEMVNAKGQNLFYQSIENRRLCCHVRKVKPLARALSGKKAWIVGLRQQQSVTRESIETVAWDAANRLVKISPLAAWTQDDVWDAIREHDIPHHPLHEKGYPSIGCAPCTRAVQPGEDARAGRWWWERSEHKECGLHKSPPGQRPGAGSQVDRPKRPDADAAPFGIGRIPTD